MSERGSFVTENKKQFELKFKQFLEENDAKIYLIGAGKYSIGVNLNGVFEQIDLCDYF